MTSSRQPIVVGYDASEDADRVLAWAIDFVKARGNPLRVVVASGDLDYLPEWSVIEQEQVVSEWARTADAWLADAGMTMRLDSFGSIVVKFSFPSSEM